MSRSSDVTRTIITHQSVANKLEQHLENCRLSTQQADRLVRARYITRQDARPMQLCALMALEWCQEKAGQSADILAEYRVEGEATLEAEEYAAVEELWTRFERMRTTSMQECLGT